MARDEPSRRPHEDALIGGRERRPIGLEAYDPRWPQRFAAERSRIRGALAERALMIEHIGSTAVPGLDAKPVVDVLVAVIDVGDPSIVSAFVAAGYVLRVDEPGHRMLRTAQLDVHVHLWAHGDPEIARHLRFRDRLRASQEDRSFYADLKHELASRPWDDMNAYAAATSPLIAEILARAEAEAEDAPEPNAERGASRSDPKR
jgi:GrpB-like predicted nucleotidyltransferase (UPF0157 family)